MKINIEISARHVHFNQGDFEKLFGDKSLTKIKELSQKDFACEETVTIKGPKSEIKNVRILGPFREKTQVEISRTDAINLGIDAPLKISGDLPGSPIEIMHDKKSVKLDCAIVAKRHLHLSPSEAQKIGYKKDDRVSVRVDGDRSLVFNDIIVRIADHFSQSVHIDTDEANAAGLKTCSYGELKNKDM